MQHVDNLSQYAIPKENREIIKETNEIQEQFIYYAEVHQQYWQELLNGKDLMNQATQLYLICLNQFRKEDEHQCLRHIPWQNEAIKENYQYQDITYAEILKKNEKKAVEPFYNGKIVKNPWKNVVKENLEESNVTGELKWKDYPQKQWLEEETSESEKAEETRWEKLHFIC